MATGAGKVSRRAAYGIAIFAISLGVGVAAGTAQQLSKEETLERMTAIRSEIEALRVDAAGDPGAEGELAPLFAEYEELSASLGGDEPPVVAPPKLELYHPASAPLARGTGSGATGRVAAKRLGANPRTPPPAPLSAPAFCAATTSTTVTSSPALRIPPSGTAGTLTATIAVSGVGPFLWDLDVTTFMPHTFASDLDITLMSPQGTIVTLTTDNGGGTDNVFNGTRWDDQANPLGAVPYVTNAGLATDHPYVNLVTATPLVPEEALGAFVGENPNGTWTLTIVDDLGGDIGSLDSWSLDLTTLPLAPTTHTLGASSATAVAIPDAGVATSSIVITGAVGALRSVDVQTSIRHTLPADLDVTLTSPAGKIVTLTTDNGGSNDDVFNGTVWSDVADLGSQVPYGVIPAIVTDTTYTDGVAKPSLVPEEAMAAFQGENPNGTWTLTISDDLPIDTGTLDGWSLDLVTVDCPCTLTCGADVDAGTDPGLCSATVAYDPPVATGVCGTVTCTPPSGSSFAVGPTIVTCSSTAGPSCEFQVTVEDVEPPVADITAPEQQSCHAGTVTIEDASSDNCGIAGRSYDPPGGPTYTATGNYHVTLLVSDDAGLTGEDTVDFTIDGVGPIVDLREPCCDQNGMTPVTIPIDVSFASSDDPAGVVREVIKLQGCVIYDGDKYGDKDGLLSDETIQLTKRKLCDFMTECHQTFLIFPKLRVEATDACGNQGWQERIIRRRLNRTEVCY